MSSRRKSTKPVSLTSKGVVGKQVTAPATNRGYGHLGANATATTSSSVTMGGLGAPPTGGTPTTTQPPNTAPVPPIIPLMTQDQQSAALQAAAFFMSLQGWQTTNSKDHPVFDGTKENFNTFMEKLEAYLTDIKLWDVVTDDNPEPERNQALYRAIIKCLDHASTSIISTNGKNDGKVALEALKTHHQGDLRARKRQALLDLHHLKMQENEDPQKFLVRTDTLKKTLSTLDTFRDDEMLIISVIEALPESQKLLKVTLRAKTSIDTYEVLRSTIASQTQFDKQTYNESIGDTLPSISVANYIPTRVNGSRKYHRGFASHRGSRRLHRGKKFTPYRAKPYCNHCHKSGHHRGICWILNPSLRNDNGLGAAYRPSSAGEARGSSSRARMFWRRGRGGRARGGSSATFNVPATTMDTNTHQQPTTRHQSNYYGVYSSAPDPPPPNQCA